MSEAQRFETEEFLAGARRMVSALSQMDDAKIVALEKQAAKAKEELKAVSVQLTAIKAEIAGHIKLYAERVAKDTAEHAKRMTGLRKDAEKLCKEMNAEIEAEKIHHDGSIAELLVSANKAKHVAEKEQFDILNQTKDLKDALELLKQRVIDA